MENPFHKIMVRRRTELKLSQADAAKRAGVARSTWIAWEHVHGLPRMQNWKAIAAAIQVPIEELEQAGSASWYAQRGPSPLQSAALEAAGQPIDGKLPPYQFASNDLRQIDYDLNVNIDKIGQFPWWGKELAAFRGHIRRQLIAQDAAYQSLLQQVRTFREMYTAMVAMPTRWTFKKKKVGKVRKPPTPKTKKPKKDD